MRLKVMCRVVKHTKSPTDCNPVDRTVPQAVDMRVDR